MDRRNILNKKFDAYFIVSMKIVYSVITHAVDMAFWTSWEIFVIVSS